MTNLTTSLYAIYKDNSTISYAKDKEYPVFKITNTKYGQEITIVNDQGRLMQERASAFRFITK